MSEVLIKEQETICRMHYQMGTFVQIEATGKERGQVVEAIAAAFSEIKRIERILSIYLDESTIFRINRFAHSFPVKISLEVFQLIEEAIRFSHSTHGAFDITTGIISELFDLAEERGSSPTDEEIRQACLRVGYTNILLNRQDRTIFFKKPGMRIDLGGIGKGYAVDRAIAVLKENGIKKTLVNAGGNIFCLDKEGSSIGIKNPLKTDEIIASVLLKDGAISTSANYERSFNIGGKNYGHLIDSRTGYPVNNGILSVSIICSSAKVADALSTAVFILGQDKGMQLIDNMHSLEGIIISVNGRRPKMHVSKGMNEVYPLTYSSNLFFETEKGGIIN